MRNLLWALGALAMMVSTPALAEVGASGPAGFTVTETAHLAAPPDQVYAALIAPARWWGADHTFSRREWRDQVANWTTDWVRSW